MKMKRLILIALAAITALGLYSCGTKNDFYIMGKQEIFLTGPAENAVLAPTSPSQLLPFTWQSLRHYADTEILIDSVKTFTHPVRQKSGAMWQQFNFTASLMDSIVSTFGVLPKDTMSFYWKVQTINPEDGWCDEVRHAYFVRLEQSPKSIVLSKPSLNYEFSCGKSGEQYLEFIWDCEKYVPDYELILGVDKKFRTSDTVRVGTGKHYKIYENELDALLEDWGYGIGERVNLYWKITGSGDTYIEVNESPVRTVKARRVTLDPVSFEYLEPGTPASVTITEDNLGEELCFKWACDTAGVVFSLNLYDAEFKNIYSAKCGDNNEFSITYGALSTILSNTFEMVPGQKKLLQWYVSVNPDDAAVIPEEKREIIIRQK